MIDVISASISFIELFSNILNKDIKFYDDSNLKEAYKEAGLMDFGIKQSKPRK